MTVHELTLPIYEKSTYLTKSVACNYIIIQNDKKKKKDQAKETTRPQNICGENFILLLSLQNPFDK